MLFNSYEYILLFLPLVFGVYFLAQHWGHTQLAKCCLLASSLFFYSWWDIRYLPLLVASIVINFALGRLVSGKASTLHEIQRKLLLGLGVLLNLGLLGYFKYADFFITNINVLLSNHIALLRLALPLAISFFTFQQIAFLVDSFKGHVKEYGFLNYAVFVSFFPQLIAGPIVHHRKLVPQFAATNNKRIDMDNVATGLLIFSIGLFKKVVVADTFAEWANNGHAHPYELGLVEAWATSLSYTFQLYFDFSGYSDMAIGAALLFNIRLPLNFNSPYKSQNIRDFWRRWHMTLGDFVTRYVYGALGSSKKGKVRNYVNLFISFFAVGVWHGAGWTFVVFGLLHGSAIVLHQIWRDLGCKMPGWLGWFLTFNFFSLSIVIFRAESLGNALEIYKAMLGLNGLYFISKELGDFLAFFQITDINIGVLLNGVGGDDLTPIWIIGAMLVCFVSKNSMEVSKQLALTKKGMLLGASCMCMALIFLTRASEFLYFNF